MSDALLFANRNDEFLGWYYAVSCSVQMVHCCLHCYLGPFTLLSACLCVIAFSAQGSALCNWYIVMYIIIIVLCVHCCVHENDLSLRCCVPVLSCFFCIGQCYV